METLRWLPATEAHVRKIESDTAWWVLGTAFGPWRPGDEVHLVLRGDSPPSADLFCGRSEGGVPDDVIARWLSEFCADRQALVILGDMVGSRNDPAILRCDRPVWNLPAGLAWPIFQGETADDALRAIIMSHGGPIFNAFYRLPSGWTPPADGVELRDANLATLHAHLVGVMTDVYDEDGRLLWGRGGRVASRLGVDSRPDRL